MSYIDTYNEQNQFLIEQETAKIQEAKDDTTYKIQELYLDISELKSKKLTTIQNQARGEYINRQIKDKEREIYILTITLSHTIATHEAIIKGIQSLHIDQPTP